MVNILEIIDERIVTNQQLYDIDSQYAETCSHFNLNPSITTLTITEGQLLIIDPTYLADIYNLSGEKEQYLLTKGVLMTEFGGDVNGPIFKTKCGGIKVLLAYDVVDEDGNYVFEEEMMEDIESAYIDSENLFCDSGSYIFLSYDQALKRLFEEELSENELMLIDLPVGDYVVAYEQWEQADEMSEEDGSRNLIVKKLKS